MGGHGGDVGLGAIVDPAAPGGPNRVEREAGEDVNDSGGDGPDGGEGAEKLGPCVEFVVQLAAIDDGGDEIPKANGGWAVNRSV